MIAASTRADVYTRVTSRIVAELEQGVRPWLKPWNAEHAEGRITRPLRANGQPYKGINVLMLWGEAMAQGFASPFWMTYKQAQELRGQVRKGEHGSLVVYADGITKTETGEQTLAKRRRIAAHGTPAGIAEPGVGGRTGHHGHSRDERILDQGDAGQAEGVVGRLKGSWRPGKQRENLIASSMESW